MRSPPATSPHGIGTGDVEQLSSFAVRYAAEVSLAFVTFFRERIATKLYSDWDERERVSVVSKLVIDGITKTASDWAEALQLVTGVTDLACCTMLPFAGTIASRRLVTANRRWCQICLQEAAEIGDRAVYEHLLWRLAEVKVCPVHHVALVARCPVCNRGGQIPFSANSRVGCCRHCGAWMGRAQSPEEEPSITKFDLFAAEMCSDLLALPSQLPPGAKVLPGSLVVQALRDVFFYGNGSEMGRRLGELPGQVNFYANDEFCAPLHFYLRAAYITGATMKQIFVTSSFGEQSSAHAAESFELRRATPRRVREQAELDQALRNALAEEPGTSVQAIAIDLNMEPVTVWRRSPELCSQVSRRYAAQVADRAAARRSEFEEKVKAVMAGFKDRKHRPSAQELKEALCDPNCFLNDWKRGVIRQEMTKLNW